VLTFWVYAPVILAALVWNLSQPPTTIALALAAGLLLWTPIEYVTHRYLLHRIAPHFQHHDEPTVLEYLFAPLWLSSTFAVALWGILTLALHSWQRAALVEAGTISGYLFYEALHIRIHSQAAGGVLLRFWRKHHYYHHFADDTRCYGVTSPVWDVVFRTRASAIQSPYHRSDKDLNGAGHLDIRPAGESPRRG
jgi:sterol desaturase/sphingolipid hydroxylase (fatty acid hydroxylase superfamily)